jgi:hypothetical protein
MQTDSFKNVSPTIGNAVLPAVLRLPIKKQFFDMIKDGVKLEEYRAIKKHWISRLFKYPEIFEALNNCCIECKNRKDFEHNEIGCSIQDKVIDNKTCDINKFTWLDSYFKKFEQVELINGYGKNCPTLLVECKGIKIGNTKPEWADGWNDKVFVISLGAILHSR